MSNPEITLRHPPDSRLEADARGAIVTVPASAGVALDEKLTAAWQTADGLSAEILALRRAGLLEPALPLAIDRHTGALPDPAPLVSIIIVSRDGRHHLAECLPSLQAQTYPNLEIIVVDDASSDGTAEWLPQFPQVRYLRQENGPNFAAGNNLGIAHARGELLFLLNNDTVLDAHCVQELVVAYGRQEDVGGVAALLRLYDNRPFINGLGSGLRRFGFGFDLGIGSLDVGQFEGVTEIPLLCFGAALIPKTVLAEVGLIEEGYQFYYEDADWSYRARAAGYRLIPAPQAIVYHKFSASTGKLSAAFKKRLATRNRYWFIWKNFPFFSLLLQTVLYGMDDVGHLLAHLARRERHLAEAILRGWWQAVSGIWQQRRKRRETWHGRTRHAVNLFQLANPFPLPAMHGRLPLLTHEMVISQYQPFLQKQTERRHRLLIISPDAVSSSMGGVGIRYWELAHELAQTAEVTLAMPNESDLTAVDFALCRYEDGRAEPLQSLATAADIILLSGFTLFHNPFLRHTTAYRIIDLYDPMVLENLERFANRPATEREGLHQVGVATFNELFALGDFFICASEKQRDYWLGALTAVNRVNPATYTADPTLRRLIELVPFGLPAVPPQPTGVAVKGVIPGIGENDKLIVWGGGLWDWLDPLTVIEAMPQVLVQVPTARLFFLGIRHPNPQVPLSRMAERAVQRATELNLKDTAIFFNEWTPYAERVNYLCEADVGVSLHGNHIETRFAVRTRLMDYLWARLPMVVSGGDVLSDLVQTYGLGRVIEDEGNVTAVATALIEMLQFPPTSAQFESVVAQFHWSRVAEPLKAYIQKPWRNGSVGGGTAVSLKPPTTPISHLPQKAWASLRQKGISGFWQELRAYIRWTTQR